MTKTGTCPGQALTGGLTLGIVCDSASDIVGRKGGGTITGFAIGGGFTTFGTLTELDDGPSCASRASRNLSLTSGGEDTSLFQLSH